MEIEKKWLIRKDKIPYNLSELPARHIEQFYISTHPTVRARCIDNRDYILTVKTKPTDQNSTLMRNEVEVPLNQEEYLNLKKLQTGNTIYKTRYIHSLESGLIEEIDLFEKQLDGLAYLEIEFPSIEEAENYPNPDWIEKEVSDDSRYTNSALIRLEDAHHLIP